MENVQQNIENQDLRETLVVDGHNIQSGQVKIQVEGYPILESDFERLVNSGAGWKEWARRLLLISIGAIIIFVAKIIDFFISYDSAQDKNDISLDFKNYELIALVISLLLCALFWGIGSQYKNKKDQLITKIKEHFKSVSND